jgi:hypothetical protein
MPEFSIDSFILGLEVQKINNIFRETKVEKALIRVLLKVVPDLIEKEVKRILSKDISEEEIEQYFLIVKKYISEAEKYRT